jgi:hypothetical protein
MEKLYRRNPREWRKGNDSSMDAALARAFDVRSGFRFAELGHARGADAIVLALKPEYAGDRVFAFGVGLASMVFLAYNEKTEFYLTDIFDPQSSTTRRATSKSQPGSSRTPVTREVSHCCYRTKSQATRAIFPSSASSAR